MASLRSSASRVSHVFSPSTSTSLVLELGPAPLLAAACAAILLLPGYLDKDLMMMKVAELKEELEVRGEGKTGINKAWLRRRLHAAIVREYLEAMADQ
jgi:hypothetical protein